MGVERSTFLLDADGNVQKAWRKVKPAGHAEAVLSQAKA
jgi:peroxiredoxin Q/BCP